MKTRLLGKTPEELRQIALEAGLPAFAGKQVAQWLYQKRVRSIADMTNLSKQGREVLSEHYEVGMVQPIDVQVSADGTKKYLFPVRCPVGAGHDDNGVAGHDGNGVVAHDVNGVAGNEHRRYEESFVEAVMIPDQERKTLCVSSQAGCKMG